MNAPLLELNDVRVYFPVRKGVVLSREVAQVKAVDGVSMTLQEGEIVGLVGESGCGKSTLARAIVRLVPPTSGSVHFEGQDLGMLTRTGLNRLRPKIQMIFQDPYASLNPRMTVFDTLAEPLLAHGMSVRKKLPGEVARLMERVGLASRFMRKYPHEFSGGQRQRIAIARALALQPRVIVADEPVSALDVSVQAQIINLIAELCRESQLSMIFISHDLSVVRHIADRIAVMYLGRIVEEGPGETIFNAPRHPYTQTLLSAIPLPDPDKEHARARVMPRGEPPSSMNPPSGCPFHPRCPYAEERCAVEVPTFRSLEAGHRAACLKVDEIGVLASTSTRETTQDGA